MPMDPHTQTDTDRAAVSASLAAEEQELHTLQYTLMLMLKQYENTSIEAIQEISRSNSGLISSTSLKAALTFVTIVPIMCVYPFLQRYFVKGLLVGAIKA